MPRYVKERGEERIVGKKRRRENEKREGEVMSHGIPWGKRK